MCQITIFSQEGSIARHLTNGCNLASLTGGDTGHLFLMFGNLADCQFGRLFIIFIFF